MEAANQVHCSSLAAPHTIIIAHPLAELNQCIFDSTNRLIV